MAKEKNTAANRDGKTPPARTLELTNLRALINNTENIMVSRDPDGRCVVFNEGFRQITLQLFGVEAAPGLCTMDLMLPGVREHWWAIFRRVLKGETYREEFSWDFPDGRRYYEITQRPIRDEAGGVIGVAEFTVDITRQKTTEIRLAETERRQQAMIANIGDVIVIIDRDGITRYKSPNVDKWFGWKPEEVVGQPALANVHPDELAANRQVLGDIFATPGCLRTGRSRYRCKDGSYKWMEYSACNLLDDPNIRGVLCNYRDITDKKQQEDELRASEAQKRAILKAIPEFMILQDWEGVYLDYHVRDESLLLMPPALFLGKNMREVLPKPLADKFLVHFRQAQEQGTVELMEYELEMPTGRRTFEARVSRVDGGKMLTIIRDITEMRQAEKALQESQANLQMLFDAIGESVFLMEPDGRLLAVNTTFAKRLGLTPDDCIGRNVYALIPPELAARRREHVKQLFATGQPVSFEDTRAGRIMLHNLRPLLGAGGKVERLVGYAIDMTAARRKDSELRASEARLRGIIENSPAGYFLLDREGIIRQVNPAWLEMHGYADAGEVLGRNFSIVQPADSADSARQNVESILAGKPILAGTASRLCKDGSICYHTFSANPVYKDGQIIGMEGFIIDTTEQERMAKALSLSEERLRMAHKATNDVVWDWDVENDSQQWNEAGVRVFGWTEIVERPVSAQWWVERVHPDDLKRVEDGFFAVVKNPAVDFWHDEYRFRKADGAYADVMDRGFVIRAQDGRAVRMIGAMLDISERKRAEQKLRESEERLRGITTSIPGAVYQCVTDKAGNLRMNYISERAVEILGRPSDVLLDGRMVFNSVHPDDLHGFRQSIKEAAEAMKAWEYEFRIATAAGDIRWIYAKSTPCRLSAQQEITWNGILLDITARKAAEAASRESKERFRLLVEGAPFGLSLMRPDQSFIFFNQRFTELLGYTLEDLPDKQAWFRMAYPDPDYRRQVTEAWSADSLMRDKGNASGPARMFKVRCKNGSGKIICFRAVTLAGGNQLLSYEDNTGRIEAENKLRTSEALHRSLVEAIPDIVMRFDREGRHLFVSENVAEVVDIQAASFIGKTHRELGFPENMCEMWGNAIRGVFATGMPHETEFTFAGHRGEIVFSWRLLPEYVENGDEVSSVLSISRDITDRKQAELALRESEKRYRELFDSMVDGFALHEMIFAADGTPCDYRFLAVNPAFERLTGMKAADLVGRRALEVIPNLEAHWIETYGRVVTTGEPAHFENFAAAQGRHYEVIAYRPAPGQFATVFTNITERRQMEESLRQAQKMDAIGQLAGGVAHDFNNQLAGVLGYADILLKRLEDPTLKRYAENICAAARRSADLTAKLLAFSRKGQFQMVPVDMQSVVRETVEMLLHTIDRRIRISQHLTAQQPMVVGDPSQLQNSLLNLGLNARDAMPDGGELSFATRDLVLTAPLYTGQGEELPPGDYLQIIVADTGCGMPPEVKEHIFEPFFTTKPQGKGTGMGLAAVYGTVKQHRGGISVYSKVGHGTEFKIYLPVAANTARQSSLDDTADEGALLRPLRVLVVDDEAQVRGLLVAILEDAGHKVVPAADGNAGLEVYRRDWEKLDLVILDMIMPIMNGIQVFAKMKEINPRVRALLASGYSLNEEFRAMLKQGVRGFVQKPFDVKQLQAAVAAAMAAN